MKKLKLFYCSIIALFILSGCQKEMQTTDFDYFYFDTSINIKIYYTDETKYDFAKIDQGIDDILVRLQNEFDPTAKDSTITKLNETGKITMNQDFKTVFDQSQKACKQTDGRFDATSGELINLWSINNKNYLPTTNEIKTALATVGCQKVKENGNQLIIPKGMKLDFGSIVKGYAADKIEAYLKSEGVDSALLNLGGNIQTIGKKVDGSDFRIGVMKPEVDNVLNENALIITANDQAVVTSGINQRFFEQDGQIYHHILDAKSGKPADNQLASVTILTDKGIDADTLSTVTFIMGLEAGNDYINSLPGVEAIFITRDHKFYVTDPNLPIEVVDDSYSRGELVK